MPGYLLPVVVTAAVIVLPILIGNWLARVFRMPDHGWRIALVLFAVLAGSAITYFGWPPKLGIDLSGGSKLIYEVNPTEEQKNFEMDKLISAVTRRVNPQGVSEVSVRPFGPDAVEIIIPEADNQEDAARIEEKISSAGTLEFRILADTRDARHDRAIALTKSNPSWVTINGANGKPIARWIPMTEQASRQFVGNPNVVTRKNQRDQYEILVMLDNQNVNGDYLSSVVPSHDEMGSPAVAFTFNNKGARLFGRLTGDNRPDPANPDVMRYLGIILDGTLNSAPVIKSVITDNGQISGNFNERDVQDLVDVLRAGQLPVRLSEKPVLSQVIDATLGPDTIRKGAYSMLFSVIAVILFMLWYYRFSGLIACVCLVLNVLLTLAAMITIKAAFTLPGLAGLVLTVGMAVDANVLIYERIREELARGAALRMAIRNGFSRAMTTIIDSNVTTILTALVLYVIGSAEVKGFAITLFIGLALSLFTATFCARVVFDIAERQGWIRELKMMQFVGETHFDFLGVARPAIIASLLIIGIGLVGVFARGSNLLNIDFTGGTQITLLFNEPQPIAGIRQVVAENEEVLPDASVNYVAFRGEEQGKRVEINTSQQDQALVEKRLAEVFAGKLATQQMKFSDVQPIPGTPETSAPTTPAVETATPPATPPAESAPAAETPAETPPAENKAPAEQPAAESAPPATPIEPAPSANPQSSTVNPTRSLATEMADYWQARGMIGARSAITLAQADQATAEQPAAEQPAAEQPTATTAPAESAPAREPAAEPAATSPAPEAPAAEAPAAAPVTVPSDAIGSIETVFAGGTSADLEFSDSTEYDVLSRTIINAFQGTPEEGVRFELYNLEDNNRPAGRSKTWQLKVAPSPDESQRAGQAERLQAVLAKLQAKLAAEPWFPSITSFGGKVAASTQEQALYALAASLILIIAYIWIRFEKIIFGIAAVVAVVHDVFVALGMLALSYYLAPYLGFLMVDPFKIDLPIVAAFLTLIGYSLNDTIVIFDRIREIRGKSPNLTADMINLAVNQTLSRTILTSLTVFMTVLILYIGGGQGIHGFAFALLVGVIAGTYSTVYIASPVLLWMYNWGKRRAAQQAGVGVSRQASPAR